MKFKIDIKSRWDASIKFSYEIDMAHNASAGLKLGAAVKEAYKTGAVLRGAVLTDADLRGAVLTDAVLRGAVLTDADLRDADLRGAVLRGAVLTDADLRGADLRGADLRDADLTDADLRGADLTDADLTDADLTDADLTDADLRGVPFIENIDAKMLAAIEANKAAGTNGLKMDSWHGKGGIDETNWCQTTHCRAGYAVCLAGKEGFDLEKRVGAEAAGILIYLKSTPDAPVPNFYASDEEAMKDIRARAAKQSAT